jgi:hypothetical protein
MPWADGRLGDMLDVIKYSTGHIFYEVLAYLTVI